MQPRTFRAGPGFSGFFFHNECHAAAQARCTVRLAPVPTSAFGGRGPTPKTSLPDVATRLKSRTWPISATVVLLCLAVAYFFAWGPTVQHLPYWDTPGDLWNTYTVTTALVHGHFGAVYAPRTAFFEFPGILVVLAPIAALTNALGMGADVYPAHVFAYPKAFLLLGPYEVLISAFALFACDALAERLGVDWRRRGVLALVEGVVLFNVSVFWGHPEDAVAIGFALYALIAALDGRFTQAGWLLGFAVAVQPLVVVALPILLAIGGRTKALGLIVRGVIPAAVLVIAPLVSDAHATLHALLDQPAYPLSATNHVTPWTFLAPKLGGSGSTSMVGGGPVRIFSLLLACVLGWWSLRLRNRPAMLVWVFALALALRCYTESVMTDYYMWPALAVGLVVAARCSNLRFAIAIVAAVFTTIAAQWHYSWLPWWLLDAGGITLLLAASWFGSSRRDRRRSRGPDSVRSSICRREARSKHDGRRGKEESFGRTA